MIEYIVDNHKYSLSYSELKEEYQRFVAMKDKEFLANLPAALHLACVICWLKEVPTYVVLGDRGIIHELAHEIHIGRANTTALKEIRKSFKLWLKLD